MGCFIVATLLWLEFFEASVRSLGLSSEKRFFKNPRAHLKINLFLVSLWSSKTIIALAEKKCKTKCNSRLKWSISVINNDLMDLYNRTPCFFKWSRHSIDQSEDAFQFY